MCLDFIKQHDNLDKGQFDWAVNKMWVDKEAIKPKNGGRILELLSCANSAFGNSIIR